VKRKKALLQSAILVLGIAVSVPAMAEPDRCLSPQQGRDLIESSRIRPFPEAAQAAGIERDLMQDVQLCPSNGGYHYEVDMLKQGRRERTEIPADSAAE